MPEAQFIKKQKHKTFDLIKNKTSKDIFDRTYKARKHFLPEILEIASNSGSTYRLFQDQCC